MITLQDSPHRVSQAEARELPRSEQSARMTNCATHFCDGILVAAPQLDTSPLRHSSSGERNKATSKCWKDVTDRGTLDETMKKRVIYLAQRIRMVDTKGFGSMREIHEDYRSRLATNDGRHVQP